MKNNLQWTLWQTCSRCSLHSWGMDHGDFQNFSKDLQNSPPDDKSRRTPKSRKKTIFELGCLFTLFSGYTVYLLKSARFYQELFMLGRIKNHYLSWLSERYIFDVCRYKLIVPCLDVFKATFRHLIDKSKLACHVIIRWICLGYSMYTRKRTTFPSLFTFVHSKVSRSLLPMPLPTLTVFLLHTKWCHVPAF